MLRRRRGQGMTEYIIIVGLIGILLVAAVEKYKDIIKVTIIGSKGAMDAGMGPQYWGAPDAGGATSKQWDPKKGGDGKNYKWNGTAWVPA
jgi:hypothetical protein